MRSFAIEMTRIQNTHRNVALIGLLLLFSVIPLSALVVFGTKVAGNLQPRAEFISSPQDNTEWEKGITAIATSPDAYHFGANIWGTKIVWTDYKAPAPESNIWLYDTLTRTKRRVTTQPYVVQSFVDIYGNKIVWQDSRGGENNPDIYLFDLTTNSEKQLTDASPLESPFSRYTYQAHPSIYGDKVVYTDYASGEANTVLYDLTTNTVRALGSFPKGQNWAQFRPKIYKNLVVW